MNKRQRELKKAYQRNPERAKSLRCWRRDPTTVDVCPICNRLFSEHSLKDMGICQHRALVNIEEAKWNFEVVNGNWGKGGMICASIEYRNNERI